LPEQFYFLPNTDNIDVLYDEINGYRFIVKGITIVTE